MDMANTMKALERKGYKVTCGWSDQSARMAALSRKAEHGVMEAVMDKGNVTAEGNRIKMTE